MVFYEFQLFANNNTENIGKASSVAVKGIVHGSYGVHKVY